MAPQRDRSSFDPRADPANWWGPFPRRASEGTITPPHSAPVVVAVRSPHMDAPNEDDPRGERRNAERCGGTPSPGD